jgi:hypothetical protein
MILEDKVLDVIEGKAKITEGKPGEEVAAAESTTESQEGASKAKKKGKSKPEGSEERR